MRNRPREFEVNSKEKLSIDVEEGDVIVLHTRLGTKIAVLKCLDGLLQIVDQRNDLFLNPDMRALGILKPAEINQKAIISPGERVILGRSFWGEESRCQNLPWEKGEKAEVAPDLKDRHLRVRFRKIKNRYVITLKDLGWSTSGFFARGENISENDVLHGRRLSCVREGRIESADGNRVAITEQGSREMNQDGALIGEDSIAVVDGLKTDGHWAARQVLKQLAEIENKGLKMPQILFNLSYDLKERTEHGLQGLTTFAMAREKIKPDGKSVLEVGHAGDSKIFVIDLKKKKIIHETRDDSRIQNLIDTDHSIELDRYRAGKKSNVITNFLPLPEDINGDCRTNLTEIDIEDPENTLVIACSDGISGFVSPEEILEIALKNPEKCEEAIMALARSRHDQVRPFIIKLKNKWFEIIKNAGDNRTIAIMRLKGQKMVTNV